MALTYDPLLLDEAVKNVLRYDAPGSIVLRGRVTGRGLSQAPYLTTFPRFPVYGACRMGMPEHNVVKIFTCEVRWPGNAGIAGCAHLGEDTEAFVFAGKMVSVVAELTKRAVAVEGRHSTVNFADTWKSKANNGRLTLQRLFTIECQVDFRDESKLGLFEKIIQQAARHIYGQSALLGDGVKPEIVIHGHDFFKGHTDIALFDDTILAGDAAIQEASAPKDVTTTTGVEPASGDFSDELLAALKA